MLKSEVKSAFFTDTYIRIGLVMKRGFNAVKINMDVSEAIDEPAS
jgi:hypothetical protein